MPLDVRLLEELPVFINVCVVEERVRSQTLTTKAPAQGLLETSSLCGEHVWRALCCITMDLREREAGQGSNRVY